LSEQRGERITVIVLLPKYYNPDERGQRKKVERNKFKVTCKEITEMMMQRYGEGGCTLDPEPKKGFWGRAALFMKMMSWRLRLIIFLTQKRISSGWCNILKTFYVIDSLKRQSWSSLFH